MLPRALLVVFVAALAFPGGAAADTVWLCQPGAADNPCVSDLTADVSLPNGETRTEVKSPAADPAIDCFYVYPTISGQQTLNSDLTIEDIHRAVARVQASRFSEVCRIWAPMYRQVTARGLFAGGLTRKNLGIAYRDVRAAWREYLDEHNGGRGVVLIGHSQGAGMLVRLARKEIDDRPGVRRRLVSAILLGGDVTVRKGSDRGGDFDHIRACRAARQTGCVIAYSSFSTPPPRGLSIFARVTDRWANQPNPDRLEVLCTNPAALRGGSGALRPYFASGSPPWLSPLGLYEARCRKGRSASWLHVSDVSGPSDPRPRVEQSSGPAWGLHNVDVNLTLGNLVSVVRRQAGAWARG